MSPHTLIALFGFALVAMSGISYGTPTNGSLKTLEPGTLVIHPEKLRFESRFDYAQVLISEISKSGVPIDVTRDVSLEGGEELVDIDERGLIMPLRDGRGTLIVRRGDRQLEVPFEVAGSDNALVPNYLEDISPWVSRLGCNTGTCHGAEKGKNGFKLSLRGYDPTADHRALTDDLAGRRFNPSVPERSLFLLKATAEVPHEGGLRLDKGSRTYDLFKSWIEQGAPLDQRAPQVVSLELYPSDPVLPHQGASQQMAVVARYDNGQVRDVTREAFIETSDIETTRIDDRGLVEGLRPGEASILARFEGHYVSTRLSVLKDDEGFEWPDVETWGEIDRLVYEKLRRVKTLPSDVCDDAEFLRRISLDLTGLPPTSRTVRMFLRDQRDSRIKREELIDRLIGSVEFVEYWTNKWSDLLQINPKFLGDEGARRLQEWVRTAIASNMPYDRFVANLLDSDGSTYHNPPTAYYKILREPDLVMENTTQLFLGIRFNCNKCHDHPFERWTRDDHWNLAAYFAQIQRTNAPDSPLMPRRGGNQPDDVQPSFEEIIGDAQEGELNHPDTQAPLVPQLPYEVDSIAADSSDSTKSRRRALTEWLTAPDNPYFAKSYVNRVWSYFLGPGLIEPVDDIRASNPPSNPKLLDELTSTFVEEGFDVRKLIRRICMSRVYQHSTSTNEWNEDDRINYSHALPRRLSAETLHDAIHLATGTDSRLPGQLRGTRATALNNPQIGPADGFLELFGRPARESACECERSSDVSLGQALNLVNGPTVAEAIQSKRGAITDLVRHAPDDASIIEELYLAFLGRFPKQDEQAQLNAMLDPTSYPNASALSDPEYEALEKKFATWRESISIAQWTEASPGHTLSEGGSRLTLQEDGSFLVEGDRPDTDVYKIVLHTTLEKIRGLRLEVLPHESLPAKGPGRADNGNFVLNDLRIVAMPLERPELSRVVKSSHASASFSQQNYGVQGAIDEDPRSGWAVSPRFNQPHTAYFEFAAKEGSPDIGAPGGTLIVVTLTQSFGSRHTLGRFRLSLTTSPGPIRYHGLPDHVVEAFVIPDAERSPQHHQVLYAHFVRGEEDLLKQIRLATAQDIAWALVNSSAFLFNH